MIVLFGVMKFVLFGVECRQRHFHHPQLLVVLLLLPYLVVYVEQPHVVLPKRTCVSLAQSGARSTAEIMPFLCLTHYHVFVFEVELLLVDEGVPLLHVLAWARHLFLHKRGHTSLWVRVGLNLSSLAIIPNGFFFIRSEEGASVW